MATLVTISKKKAGNGPSPIQRIVRGLFVAGYVAIVIACFVAPITPRVFWTMALPILPAGIVLAGFHPWRNVCPLASWGELGQRVNRGKQRRVPRFMERWAPVFPFAFLFFALAARLITTNGDGPWLGTLLVVLGLMAALTNWLFTGKTWCNFICPVATIERIYTEPNSLRRTQNSQCVRCTACKRGCPDIDQEAAYWRDVGEFPRKLVYYGFPGLVLAFYVYYWLRAGDWDAYFGGAWTAELVSHELVFGEGFFFWPGVPAIVAAPLSLFAFVVASYLIFEILELIAGRIWAGEAGRHRVLSVAAFTAFSIFYVFAGQPSLRRVPYMPEVVAFIAPVIAMAFLVRRWFRTRKAHLEERSAKRLLQQWDFDEPPPEDVAGVFAYFKAREHMREQQVSVYRDAVVECHSGTQITAHEVHLLEMLRQQLGITEAEHRQVMEDLTERQTRAMRDGEGLAPEERLQREGYREALSAALLAKASQRALRRIREEWGIAPKVHKRTVDELRGESSPLLREAEERLDRVEHARAQLRVLAPLKASGMLEFAHFVLHKQQIRGLERVTSILTTVGGGLTGRAAASALWSADQSARAAVLDVLRQGNRADLVDRVAAIVAEPSPQGGELDKEAVERALGALLVSGDPYQRAAALSGIGYLNLEAFRDGLRKAAADEEPIVRETLVYASRRAPGLVPLETLQPLTLDADPEVRRAAQEAVQALRDSDAQGPAPNPIRVKDGKTLPPIPDEAFSGLSALDKILFLRCVPLFARLDPEDLHEVVGFTEEELVVPPDTICRQGETSDDLFVIISGTASVLVAAMDPGLKSVPTTPGKRVATLGPGDVVGELAAIDQSPRSATVRPEGRDVRLLKIRGSDFRRRLARRPDVAPRLLATLSRRLRETLARVR